jgi:hypothetical protein
MILLPFKEYLDHIYWKNVKFICEFNIGQILDSKEVPS